MKEPNYNGIPAALVERLKVIAQKKAAQSDKRRSELPISMTKLTERAHFIDTAEKQCLFLGALATPGIRHVGVDTEYRYEEGYSDDITHLIPLLLSASICFESDAYSGQVTFVLDLRNPDLKESVEALLACRHKLVIHYLRAEYFCLRRLGFQIHNNVFDSCVAAKLLSLGHFHSTEYQQNENEVEQVREGEKRKKKIERATSLLASCNRFGITHRFAVAKDHLRDSFLRHGSEPYTPEQIAYAAEDAIVTAQLYEPMVLALLRKDLLSHFERVEMPVAPVLCEIEWNGAGMDDEKRVRAKSAMESASIEIERSLLEQYGLTNPNSRDQVIASLHKVCGLDILELFRSSFDGKLHIGKSNFERLAGRHSLINLLFHHRRYTGAAKQSIVNDPCNTKDSRVHPVYDILGTATGRVSTSRPNINGVGKILRPIITPAPGCGIGEVDYSQIEMAIAAAHFNDDTLIEAYNSGDIYCEIAKRFYRAKIDEADLALPAKEFKNKYSGIRDMVKPLCLGIIYNKQKRSLSIDLNVSEAEAERLRRQFLDHFPKVRDGLERAALEAKRNGYARTVTGLRRFRSAKGRQTSKEINWARNHPIQGSAADVFKMAVARIHPLMQSHNAKIIAIVYDAIVFEAPTENLGKVGDLIQAVMVHTLQEVYPKLKAKADINLKDPSCWNKDGHSDSIDRLLQDPLYRL